MVRSSSIHSSSFPSMGAQKDSINSTFSQRMHSQHSRSIVDEEATQQMLQSLLISKNVGEDPLTDLPGMSGPATPLPESPSRGLRSPSVAVVDAPPSAMAILEMEAEREAFVSEVCSNSTRFDVQDWVRKIFDMQHEGRMAAARREAQERRRRKFRSSSVGSVPESNASGAGTTPTALQAAGGNIAASASRPPKSADSAGSLEVNFNGNEEPLSLNERVQAFLNGSSPELEEHVNAHVARRTEELRSKVDGDLATKFLRQVQYRRVFDGRANYLRWQSARHQLLQKHLDKNMTNWIVEAISSWEQRQPLDTKDEDKDVIFDFLTKRAAHIDSGKLPTEIPLFKTMHASYSLPSMWKDKYTC